MRRLRLLLACAFAAPLAVIGLVSGEDGTKPKGDARQDESRPSVYVERVTLSEVQESVGFGLNIGAIVRSDALARGIQKAADVYGLNLDIFVATDPTKRRALAEM